MIFSCCFQKLNISTAGKTNVTKSSVVLHPLMKKSDGVTRISINDGRYDRRDGVLGGKAASMRGKWTGERLLRGELIMNGEVAPAPGGQAKGVSRQRKGQDRDLEMQRFL